jgi:hypothetical protein
MSIFKKGNYKIIQRPADKEDPNFKRFMSEVDFIFEWMERRIPTCFSCNMTASHTAGLWELGFTIERLGEKFDIITRSPRLNDLYPNVRAKFQQWSAERRSTFDSLISSLIQ